MPSVKNMYLVVYNVACAAGWGYVLLACIRHVVAGGKPQELYDDVEQVLQIVQTAAFMEVVHALLGVVRSPWLVTLMQVASRLVLLWGFMWMVPATQGQYGALLCITSWAAVEVPTPLPAGTSEQQVHTALVFPHLAQTEPPCRLRIVLLNAVDPWYLFYAFGVMGSSPFTLFYLRYSLFAILYPTGITGEVMTMVAGLPDLKASQDTLALDLGPLHISGYMFAVATLAVYVVGAPSLYLNMVTNRKVAFRKRNGGAAKKTA